MKLFTDVVSEISGGKLNARATAKLTEVVEACKRTCKKGKLALELEFTPRGSDSKQCDISFKLTAKVPESTLAPSVFFISGSNELTRDDPDQMDMFRTKDKEKASV